jgi:hypothetical protein
LGAIRPRNGALPHDGLTLVFATRVSNVSGLGTGDAQRTENVAMDTMDQGAQTVVSATVMDPVDHGAQTVVSVKPVTFLVPAFPFIATSRVIPCGDLDGVKCMYMPFVFQLEHQVVGFSSDKAESTALDQAPAELADGPSKIDGCENRSVGGMTDAELYDAAVKAVTRADRLALLDLW